MTYIDDNDIVRRMGVSVLVQLTDTNNSGAIDAAVLTAVRLAAEGEVNSYLARRYSVPVDVGLDPALPGPLAAVTLDLVEYRLHARRPPVPEDVVRRRGAAREWLVGVATGAATLPSSAPLSTTPLQGPRAGSTGNPAALSRDTLEGL